MRLRGLFFYAKKLHVEKKWELKLSIIFAHFYSAEILFLKPSKLSDIW